MVWVVTDSPFLATEKTRAFARSLAGLERGWWWVISRRDGHVSVQEELGSVGMNGQGESGLSSWRDALISSGEGSPVEVQNWGSAGRSNPGVCSKNVLIVPGCAWPWEVLGTLFSHGRCPAPCRISSEHDSPPPAPCAATYSCGKQA